MMEEEEEDKESTNQEGHLMNSFLDHWSRNKIAKSEKLKREKMTFSQVIY